MTSTATRRSARGTNQHLLYAAQRGDKAALEQLIRCFEPLVRRVVWRLRPPPGCEREDLAQEARIGLLAAIRAWQPDRGPFPAFADRCVQNQALLAVHAAARHKHQLLSRAISLTPEHAGAANATSEQPRLTLLDTLTAPDPVADPEARLLLREQLDTLVRALPALTSSERRALTGVLNGHSYQQLAAALGGTPKAAAHAAYRARRKLAATLPPAA